MASRTALFLLTAALTWSHPSWADVPAPIIVTAPGGDADGDDAIRRSAADLDGMAGPGLLRALGASVAAISLPEAQGNSYQPALVYRGFSASALQGGAQGLAVYLDGGRFNLPFGDTVQFDLLPDNALETVLIQDSNPVYGLNALGGAIALTTRTGRSSPGLVADAALGDHGRQMLQMSGGMQDGNFSLFLAGQARSDDGWRDYSPSRLYNGYADAGWDGAQSGLHIKLLAADTDLTGNGTSPVALLAVARDAVFTHPDTSRNRLIRGSLHPWVALGDDSRIEASLYGQTFRQRTLNGDLADLELCDQPLGALCLEGADDADLPLRDTNGAMILAPVGVDAFGVLNRSQTRTRSAGLLTQYVRTAPLFGRDNNLTFGISHDRSLTRFAAATELGALDEDRGVTGLGPIIRQPDNVIAPVSVDVRSRATGVFLANRLALTSRLSAEIGLRWNETHVILEDQIGTALNGNHRFRSVNPGLELDYALSSRSALHMGYARTSRAPTAAELSCADEAAPCSLTNFFVADPPLDEVVARSWSAGASGAWAWAGLSGQWRLSAYRTDINNDIQFTAAATRGRAFFRNIGQTRREGLEADLSVTRGAMSVDLGYAFLAARYRSAFTANSPDNPGADDDGQIRVTPGKRLTGLPRHRGVATLRYQPPATGLTLRADLQAQSGQWRLGDDANLARPVPGFVRLDLGARWQARPTLALFADVTNVLNRRYASFGAFSETDAIDLVEAPGATDPHAESPGAPRRVFLGLRLTL